MDQHEYYKIKECINKTGKEGKIKVALLAPPLSTVEVPGALVVARGPGPGR